MAVETVHTPLLWPETFVESDKVFLKAGTDIQEL